VRHKTCRRLNRQQELFAPRAPICWAEMPAEVRSRTLTLLVRLLRQHVRRHRVAQVCDE